jgi:hypothetical protein
MIQPQVCSITGCAGQEDGGTPLDVVPGAIPTSIPQPREAEAREAGIPGLDGEPSRTVFLILILILILLTLLVMNS